MRVWAQSWHRSTWPPSAAVRQASIADMTRSWPALTWPAFRARQASPWRRKTSATSSPGRDIGSGRRRCSEVQELERALDLADDIERDPRIARSGRDLAVAK